MSSVDNRVVQMKFDNKQFESGVKTTLGTLEKLKDTLNMASAARSLSKLEEYSKTFTMSTVSSLDSIAYKLSNVGSIGTTIFTNLTNSAMQMASKLSNMVISPIISGGKSRALNIEQAKFQLAGLEIAWEDIEEDISYGVQDTAYGLDSAAKAASQLVASGVQLGDEMKSALRGISGVAAMTNSSYDDIARIFTTVAGNGRLMADQLNQLGSRGLNAASTLAKALNVTEQEVRDMTSKGKINFQMFSEAMDDAYGAHAKDANKTFTGALSNMRAALSRIGAKFATPAFENLKDVMNALIPVINAINKGLDPLVEIAANGMEKLSKFAVESLGNLGGLGKVIEKEEKKLEDFAEIAKQVLNGDFGNGETRKKKLEELGYSYEKVQATVNALLGSTTDLEKAAENAVADVKLPTFDSLISIIGNIVKSAKNVGKSVLSVAKTISNSFKDVFPQKTLEDVLSFTKNLSKLTQKFKITKESSDKLKDSFHGVFSILDIAKESVFALFRVLSPLTNAVGSFGGKLLDSAAKIGAYIFNIDKSIKTNDTFYKILSKIAEYIRSDFISLLPKIKVFYESFCDFISPLVKRIDKAKSSLSDFTSKGLSEDKLGKIKIVAGIFKTLAESVLNVGTAFVRIAKPVFKALVDMFPSVYLNSINNFVEGVKNFTSHLIVSDKTVEKIKGTFKGLFAVVDIIRLMFSALVRTLFPAASNFGKLGDGIFTVTSFLGENIAELDKFLRENDVFYNSIQGVINLIKSGFGLAKDKVNDLFTAFEEMTGIDLNMPTLEDFSELAKKIKDRISNLPDVFSSAKDSISEFFELFSPNNSKKADEQTQSLESTGTVLDFLSKIISVISPKIGGALKGLSEAFGDTFGSIDIDRMLKIINIGTFSGIIVAINKVRGVISTIFSFGRVFHNLNGILVGVKGTLTAYTKDLKANTFLKIAGAIAILAASLVAISMIKEDKLANALSAITSLFVTLFGAMIFLDDCITGNGLMGKLMSLLLLVVAISSLSKVVRKLGKMDNDQLTKGLLGFSTVLLGLMAFLAVSDFDKISLKKGAGLLLIALALDTLTIGVKKLGKLDIPQLIKGLIGMAALLAEIAVFTNFVGNPTKLISTGLGLTIIAAAMVIFSKAVAILGSLSAEDLAKGLLGMAVALTEIFLACMFMPASLPLLSVGLVSVAIAINLLSLALKTMGSMSWEELAISLLALTGSLTAITVAMIFMKSAIPGAAALIIVSSALAILAPVLLMLGKMSLAEIGKSLLLLAGVFLVIGAAGALLTPVIPSILGLASAIAVLGVGMLAAGAGLAAASIGIVGLISAGAGLITFVKVLGELGVVIIETLEKVLTSLLNFIERSLPLIYNTAFSIIITFLKAIADNLGMIVEIGALLILNILKGLGSHLDEIIIAAATIILKFIDGISTMLPAIIDSGINLMVSFISGMADGIRDNTDKILSAIGNLVSAIVEFIISAIQKILEEIPGVGKSMSEELEKTKEAIKESLAPEEMKEIGSKAASATAEGITSGNDIVQKAGSGLGEIAKGGLGSVLGDFASMGSGFGSGFSLSLGESNNQASNAGKDLGESATNGLSSVMEGFGSLGSGFGSNFSSSLGDTNDLVSSAAAGLGESTTNGLDLNLSGLGENTGDTYASGLLESEDKVDSSTKTLTKKATKSFFNANEKFKKSGSDNGTSYAKGISSEQQRVSNAGKGIAEKGVMGAVSKLQGYKNAGVNSGKGFAAGLNDTQGEVSNAASAVAQAALMSMKRTLNINSPSKEFAELGAYSDEGLALGLKQNVRKVIDASKAVGEQTKRSLGNSLSKVNDIINDDLTADPTIRPVMDLSDVTGGVSQINDMFGKRTLNFSGIGSGFTNKNMQLLSEIAAGMQNRSASDISEIIKTISELRGDINDLGTVIGNIQLRMDTGALVGAMVAPMDDALGRRLVYKGRSN